MRAWLVTTMRPEKLPLLIRKMKEKNPQPAMSGMRALTRTGVIELVVVRPAKAEEMSSESFGLGSSDRIRIE